VGYLAVLYDRPMIKDRLGANLLRIFASRAGAEMDLIKREATLRLRGERLAQVLDSVMIAIVSFNSSMCIELFNREAEEIFQCPSQTLKPFQGQTLTRLHVTFAHSTG
jgi:PAS domain-containing protein